MGINRDSIFVDVSNIGQATIAAANTARDGSGVLVTLLTAGSSGTRMESVTFVSAQAAVAANSAMVGRIFLTDTAGANPRLIAEVVIPTVTASNTAVGATATFTWTNGLFIASGQIVKVTQSVYAGVQDQMHVYAKAGNY